MAKVFTTDNFETEVLNAEKPVLVDCLCLKVEKRLHVLWD